MPNLIAVEVIAAKILEIRGKRVMLDKDLAKLYGVEVKVLKRAVRRNISRFPEDFMFQLSWDEVGFSRSQNVTLNSRCQIGALKQGQNIKYLPYVFTEQGVAMLSSVLNSERAIKVNIQIMRAFVKLRYILSAHKEFEIKLRELEKKFQAHDADIDRIFEAIRLLIGIPHENQVVKGFAHK